MKKILRGKKAFTLIELLVVVTILAVLISILLPVIKWGFGKASGKSSKEKIDVYQVEKVETRPNR